MDVWMYVQSAVYDKVVCTKCCRLHAHKHKHTNSVYISISIYEYTYIHTYIHVYTCICIHTHTHTHTHTHLAAVHDEANEGYKVLAVKAPDVEVVWMPVARLVYRLGA